jgi:hypothetical protein
MAEPEPRVTDAGVFIPFRQHEQDAPLPIEEIIRRLGEVGLHGRPLDLVDVPSREILLPYDPEQQPSLGTTSFIEFETFAYDRRAPKGMPMKIWSNLAHLSEMFAYVQAVTNRLPSDWREKHTAARVAVAQLGPSNRTDSLATWRRLESVERQLSEVDAEVRQIPPQQGSARRLREHFEAFQGDPFVFTDPDCTQPLEIHTGAYQRVNQTRALRTTYMSVDALYGLIAHQGPTNWSRIRGQRFDLVTIPFLNARINHVLQTSNPGL